MIEQLEAAARALWEKKAYKDAAAILKIALAHTDNPSVLDALLKNITMCYFHSNDVPQALQYLEQREGLGLATDWETKRDKANYLRYLDRYDESYQLVLSLPDNSTKYLAESWFLHRQGRFSQAFARAEQARKGQYWWGSRKPLQLPLWDGTFTDRIVIAAESGAGDEIIFARWIPEMKKYCDHLYYATNNSLGVVFEKNFGIELYDPRLHPDSVMAPSMSLPYLLKAQDPMPIEYLKAPSSGLQKKQDMRPRIGLCFHGEKTHFESALRTIPEQLLIEAYLGLGSLVNLQKDPEHIRPELEYPSLNSWSATLNVIDSLDLVVSCDTSISHAAAAMGKPTIVLTHAAAYFTWNHNEKIGRSSWYKNAWSVHQTSPCDWSGCIKASVPLAQRLLSEVV